MQPTEINTPEVMTPQQPISTVQVLSASQEKAIKNSSKSTYILGFFLAAISLIAVAYGIYKADVEYVIPSLITLAFYIVMAVLGLGYRKSTDLATARKKMMPLIVLSVISALYPIVIGVITGQFGGLISVIISSVLVISLLIGRSKLKG